MEVCVVQLVAYSRGVWVRWRGVGARRVWVLREGGEGMWHEGEVEWWREQMGEMGWEAAVKRFCRVEEWECVYSSVGSVYS